MKRNGQQDWIAACGVEAYDAAVGCGLPPLGTVWDWPSWCNARGHIDRSACAVLGVAQARRLAGCVPMRRTRKGSVTRARGRHLFEVQALPNARVAKTFDGRMLTGSYALTAAELDGVLRRAKPRKVGGDWRTARAPAMRGEAERRGKGLGFRAGDVVGGGSRGPSSAPQARRGLREGGGYGEGQRAYERGKTGAAGEAVDVGLAGNPNQGATRTKRLGVTEDWRQVLRFERWAKDCTTGVQDFLVCPGRGDAGPGDGGSRALSDIGAGGLKGLTGTTSNAGDGSRGAHAQGWACGQRVYKLMLPLAEAGEVRDAALAAAWLRRLSAAERVRCGPVVRVVEARYGVLLGERVLRCRRCWGVRYGQSPDVLWRKRRG